MAGLSASAAFTSPLKVTMTSVTWCFLFVTSRTLVTFTGGAAEDALTFTYAQAKPDLARQIEELESQVKQIEASLAALRAAVEPHQPAQAGGEKKEGK